jgi:N-acetylglucosaminyl-diphospho-decaprenol L-rhamnosyltransferase
MKDLRIVTVPWNVEKLVERCLRSLPEACRGLNWECVVVDNDSHDGSEATARRVAAEIGEGRIHVLQSGANLGFAKACNLGAHWCHPRAGGDPDRQAWPDSLLRGNDTGGTGVIDARYVLFLNPDTECAPGSLAKLVHEADKHPKGGIFGPKLQYPDGSYQESVRRFPSFSDQALIVTKLSHLFKNASSLKRYYARDIDREKEQQVDQVMGACFLVRRELIEAKLGFDERYFIWMEEVDFCKTAKENGWEVWYVPSVAVTHHQGKSFAQEFHPRRQKYFLTSLKKYFDKWYPGPRAWGIRLLAPLGMGLVWAVQFMRSPIGFWTTVLLALEIASASTIFHPLANTIICAVVGLMMLVLAWKKPSLALGLLLLERLVGSKGALLQITTGSTIPLRMVLFGAFFLGWIFHSRLGVIQSVRSFTKERTPYLALAGMILLALVNGWFSGNQLYLFADANAWFDLLLLIPVIDLARRHRESLKKQIPAVLLVGIVWLAFETFALEYLFAHFFGHLDPVYLWIRRTGVGEITYAPGNIWRIFLQSQIFLLPATLLAMAWMFLKQSPKDETVVLPSGEILRQAQDDSRAGRLFAISFGAILLSLSRSFWIGLLAGGITIKFFAVLYWRHPWKKARTLILSVLCGVLLAVGSNLIPLPPTNFASFGDALKSRLDFQEPAAASRWKLLPILWEKIKERPFLGHGFGATVTYESKDPRVIQMYGSSYQTYAFEWGWLEHWVKFGILGIPVMLWILYSLLLRIWKSDYERWLRIGMMGSLVALAITHFFTPYLNHPLGFTFFYLAEGALALRLSQKT